ncbi:DUF6473 family protein [Cereibacter sp. SYSU M97828]|nr:DUF6473 family protein [Cereibacter flavus]
MNQLAPFDSLGLSEGPSRPSGRFHAVLGGTHTLGRDVALPFPDLLAQMSGSPVLNLGSAQAGVDALLDDAVLRFAAEAETVILELPPLRNMSNAFYLVHPRRNDRFVAPTPLLTALFPEVDFTDIHFTRHLVQTLAATCEERFGEVASALRRMWRERMQEGIDQLPRAVLLDLDEGADMDLAGFGRPLVRLPPPDSDSAHADIARALLPYLIPCRSVPAPM